MLWINLIKLYGFDEELNVHELIDLCKKWTDHIKYGQMKIEFQI